MNITKAVLDAVASSQRWELYRVLSEPVRLRLLALAAAEELAIGELADLLGESQPNVSRHAQPLRQLGLLSVRREGTRTLVRLREGADADPVVHDALTSGRALCESDGALARVADVLRARDAVAREFFSRTNGAARAASGPPAELGAYLSALAPLLPRRALAVDAGTGDGGLLEVLAPIYERVVAIDRSHAQLAHARERLQARAWRNVEILEGELDGKEARRAVAKGADAVFASRLLHHAPRPADVVVSLSELCRPGGAVVVLDYARHDDESMREQADLWLGFEPAELRRFARAAGLEAAHVHAIPAPERGPDAHLSWQLLVARRPEDVTLGERVKKGARHG